MIKERKGRERKRDKSLKHVHVRKAVADYQSTQTSVLTKILNSKPYMKSFSRKATRGSGCTPLNPLKPLNKKMFVSSAKK